MAKWVEVSVLGVKDGEVGARFNIFCIHDGELDTLFDILGVKTAKQAQWSVSTVPRTAQGAGTIGARTSEWAQISVLGVKDGEVGAIDGVVEDSDGEANTLVVDIRERETNRMGITRRHTHKGNRSLAKSTTVTLSP